MIGKLYNTKYGWTLLYSKGQFEKSNDSYDVVVLPISNEELVNSIGDKNKVSFELVFKYDDLYEDSVPFAEIILN